MRRRPLTTEVTERPCIDFVAPHARAKKRPGKRAAHSAGLVPEMELPQGIDGHQRGLRPIPVPANGDLFIAVHQITFSSRSGSPLSIRSYPRSDRSSVTKRPWQI